MLNPEALDSIITEAINSQLPLLLREVKMRTPEDTLQLLSETEAVQARPVWDKIIGEVRNNKTPYAIYVEYGVGKPYNYHKPKGQVMRRWVWARMFTLAYDENKEQISKNIANYIAKWISKLTK